MTKKELKMELKRIEELGNAEIEQAEKNGMFIGLDGPIDRKYRNLRKALFEKYEKEKENE